MTAGLTPTEVEREGLVDWRLLFDRLHASLDTDDFASAAAFVARIAEAAEEQNHHPELDLSHGRLDVDSPATTPSG